MLTNACILVRCSAVVHCECFPCISAVIHAHTHLHINSHPSLACNERTQQTVINGKQCEIANKTAVLPGKSVPS